MDGYLLTFFSIEGQRHKHEPMHEWLINAATQLGIKGATAVMAAEGRDHRGKLHSAGFFELVDQPVEIQLAATASQSDQLFALLLQEGVDLFYVKTKVEFGRTGPGG